MTLNRWNEVEVVIAVDHFLLTSVQYSVRAVYEQCTSTCYLLATLELLLACVTQPDP